ncbi:MULTISPECIES: lytic transglycosylase domain-containing protein [Ralstonia]|jgi:soluble lytic murein transglycosylase-like protein|uniref:Transglycosylase SLT domain-containing protein n=2 Tax=Ralstonia pickettii TaxID=329 RepID=R0E6Z5_RALPI|nr:MULTISPECIES: lytic transglycosylase domain-containing protein [Ralstonia]ENZ77919.1 hypothetical protein OR214_02195 [Ralstonia pickettii OR214]MCM3581983.1 lytic transglycosylase domain-containing protein [Ralstonia pickettii]
MFEECAQQARPRTGPFISRLAWCAVVALLICSLPAKADCFDDAGAYQTVNPYVLRAIAWHESKGDPTAVHRNANGSIDVGELQINSVHFRELATWGITPSALLDRCINIYVAAWRLKTKMAKYGNTWEAIGAYHSETPQYRDRYARDIQQILTSWGQVSSR